MSSLNVIISSNSVPSGSTRIVSISCTPLYLNVHTRMVPVSLPRISHVWWFGLEMWLGLVGLGLIN